jgi:Pyruvate kinase, barrel domain
MLDTKGPEIRTGFFADGAKKISLNKGDNLILTSDYSFLGTSAKLACSYQALATSGKKKSFVIVINFVFKTFRAAHLSHIFCDNFQYNVSIYYSHSRSVHSLCGWIPRLDRLVL